jgi:type II secretory pathway pseudopilin PulG
MTLVETVLAMAIMAIIFAAVLPQFRAIQNSWDSKQAAAETLQNARVLIDHIHRNLSKAVRITDVSDSSETNGYIEFQSNDANNVRYDIGINNYVEFGPVGDLYDLAGPVSQLLFTCYDGNDFDTAITDVNSIRFIKVQTTLTNPAKPDQDMTFSTSAYIRTNAFSGNIAGYILKLSEPWLQYDINKGMEPALCQIDQNHYFCAFRGPADDGWAIVLTVDTDTWDVSREVPFKFDVDDGMVPTLAKIDQTHYLCAYQGQNDDGWARILKVNTGNWLITEEDSLEFDQNTGKTPALAQIDQTHYLCAYTGPGDDGWVVVLSITAPLFDAIGMETPFEFDTSNGSTPALCQIDAKHYLCAYTGLAVDGFAVVLTINTGNWTISKETPFEFNSSNGETPALYRIDDTHYLCAYEGVSGDGFVNILKVNTGNWTISEDDSFEFDQNTGKIPALAQIDQTHFLCAYTGPSSDGWSVVMNVDDSNWTVSEETPLEFDSVTGNNPALAKIDDNHYLCAYTGLGDDGFAGVLEVSEEILP